MSENTQAAVEAAKSTPAAPAKIRLDTPLVRGEQKIEEISLRKPVAGELRGIALADLMRGDVAALHVLLPRITSPTLTPADVSSLDLVDIGNIAGEVIGFFMGRADRAALYPST
jgi:hypothetical protein